MKTIEQVLTKFNRTSREHGLVFSLKDGVLIGEARGFSVGDLKAWRNATSDLEGMLQMDEGVKDFEVCTPFEIAIEELDRSQAYVSFVVTFYKKH